MANPRFTLSEQTPRVPYRGHYSRSACAARLEWTRKQTGADLDAIGQYDLDPQSLKGNIENFIGMANIPVGVAGPLLMDGSQAKGFVYAPFATTEGALVASATRGGRALSEAGGVRAHVVHQQMVRAPRFVLGSLHEAIRFKQWIEAHRQEIEAEVLTASNHVELISMQPLHLGNTMHIRFLYRTGDAAGQNMTTACTWKACHWILNHTDIPIEHFLIEANVSGDKKVSYLNFVEGRGVRVVAEAFVPEAVLQDVLKVSSKGLLQTVRGFVSGSLQAGMVGFNINVSNTIAAIFTATGQDIACVHESSLAQLDIQPGEPDGIYASMLLPSLVIGTVGGGTGLPSQRDALELMGCYGAGKVNRLAEIIAGYALALDLSTLSSIASGQFATAHEKLGRNRPGDGLQHSHLNQGFFTDLLRSVAPNGHKDAPELLSYTPISIDTSSSILTDLTSRALGTKKVGHLPYRLHYTHHGAEQSCDVMLKAKAVDAEVINMLNQMAQACGGTLATTYGAFKNDTGFRNCHIRELSLAQIQDPCFTAITPRFYHTWRDDACEIFVLAMESLAGFSHLNTQNQINAWTPVHIEAVLRDVAVFHSLYYNDTAQLEHAAWMDVPTTEGMVRMTPLWESLLRHHAQEFPLLYTQKRARQVQRIIDNLPAIWKALERAPRTLIHNDFNPRNLCLRPDGTDYRLCAYDWELATVHVPQHDIAEFLAFVLPPDTPPEVRLSYLDRYRRALERAASVTLDQTAFEEVFNLSCLDLLVNRLALYTMAHSFKDYAFLPRVLEGLFNYTAPLVDVWG